MTKYKTKDGSDRVLPEIGATVNGIIETDALIENPLFEVISESSPSTPAEPVAPAAPAVTAIPINTNEEQI